MKNSKYMLSVILNEAPIAFHRDGMKNLVVRGRAYMIRHLKQILLPTKIVGIRMTAYFSYQVY